MESGLQTFRIWAISHRILLVSALLVASAVSVIGWYYTVSAQQSTNAITPSPSPSAIKTETNNVAVPTVTKTDIQVNTSLSGGDDSKPVVKINDQPVEMPASGTLSQTIHDDNGTTTLNISVKSDSSGSAKNHSSTNIKLNSSSESSSTSKDSQ